MLNSELLLLRNRQGNKIKPQLSKNKEYHYYPSRYNKTIGLDDMRDMLAYIEMLKSNRRLSPLTPIVAHFENRDFEDKLTYILFESICYYLLNDCRAKIYPVLKGNCNIYNEGIIQSGLIYLNNKQNSIEEFIRGFKFDISGSHFQKLFFSKDFDSIELSRLVEDIDYFLKNLFIESDCRNVVSNMISELLDNALDHAKSDCLISIDVTNTYRKNGDSNFNAL